MEIKLSKLINANEAFELIKKGNDLNFSLAWKIDDIQEQFSKHVKRFEEGRLKLAKQYGIQNGENYTIPAEKMPEFAKALNEVLDSEIEIEVKLLDFKDLQVINIPKSTTINAIKDFVNRE